jgi:UDP-sulfoquinovose synthase
MRILVLGGDGFCGWPASLHLSNLGHDVTILDNLSRRGIDAELSAESLTPIASVSKRINAWNSLNNSKLDFERVDVATEYDLLLAIIDKVKPHAIVHFAEQRAAPYSMKSPRHKRYTVNNNLNATHNILCAIVESGLDIHLVHLGTMGVYGYGTQGMSIPEGYLNILIKHPDGCNIEKEILYPVDPGSIYHMTKTQDQLFFFYYNKNDRVRITDLHQGIVWGTNTNETLSAPELINRFDYDGDFGTVLNRFLVQAAVGHPLTVHGTGGQTRAFIHIRDTVKCIELALQNPPAIGDRVQIINQMTETHRVRDLANLVSELTGARILQIPNPRREAEENELIVSNRCLIDLGLQPTTLRENLLLEVRDIATKYKDRCDLSKIPSHSTWSAITVSAIETNKL